MLFRIGKNRKIVSPDKYKNKKRGDKIPPLLYKHNYEK